MDFSKEYNDLLLRNSNLLSKHDDLQKKYGNLLSRYADLQKKQEELLLKSGGAQKENTSIEQSNEQISPAMATPPKKELLHDTILGELETEIGKEINSTRKEKLVKTLMLLSEKGSASAKEMMAHLPCSPATATRLLQIMKRKGWIRYTSGFRFVRSQKFAKVIEM